MVGGPRVGGEFAGYRIERELGRGGMGVVYLATHTLLDRRAALKVLVPELSASEGFKERFLRESRLAASLDHPNIVPVYDAGDVDGALYIAMRFVEGTDLASVIDADGPLGLDRAFELLSQVADALDTAHDQGLVHRDVKPGNILIAASTGPSGREWPYLADFGLTKERASKTRLTRTGTVMGTLDFVSPEQIKGMELDGRSDQYSLACVLFQCLTGRVPFEQSDEAGVLYAHLADPPPSARELRPDLPAEIDGVIARGMAKEPRDRFPTCADLAGSARATADMAERTTTASAAIPTAAAVATADAVTNSTETQIERTRIARPPGVLVERPLSPPSPSPPKRRKRTALVVALVAIAAVASVLFLLLVPIGSETNLGEPTALPIGEASPSSEPSPTETLSPTGEPSPEAQLEVLRFDGLGPFTIGLSRDEATRLATGDFVSGDYEVSGPGCYTGRWKGFPRGVGVMFLGDHVARVDVYNGSVVTETGLGIGSSETEVHDAYAGRVKVSTHVYVQGGHYLLVRSVVPGEENLALLFETDGESVINFRSGELGAVRAVEGCF